MSESPGWPYKVLGVSFLADNVEIQKSFDHCKEAYELLIDPKKRRAFDQQQAIKKENENKVFSIDLKEFKKSFRILTLAGISSTKMVSWLFEWL